MMCGKMYRYRGLAEVLVYSQPLECSCCQGRGKKKIMPELISTKHYDRGNMRGWITFLGIFSVLTMTTNNNNEIIEMTKANALGVILIGA